MIIIKMLKGRTIETKKELVSELTDSVSRILEVEPQRVSVVIEEMSGENFAVNGELFVERDLPPK